MTAKEKATGVLDTPTAAIETNHHQIVELQPLDRKTFDALRARFAKRGYQLHRVYRAHDGRATCHARRWAQTRVFSHPHDLSAFLAVVEGAPV